MLTDPEPLKLGQDVQRLEHFQVEHLHVRKPELQQEEKRSQISENTTTSKWQLLTSVKYGLVLTLCGNLKIMWNKQNYKLLRDLKFVLNFFLGGGYLLDEMKRCLAIRRFESRSVDINNFQEMLISNFIFDKALTGKFEFTLKVDSTAINSY